MRNKRGKAIATASATVTLGIGIAIGSAGSHPITTTQAIRSVPGPTITVTRSVPGPTVTVTPPGPAAGQKIGSWSGSGNQNTAPFTVPDSGSYIVSWTYSGNVDASFGDSQPTNFSILGTGSGFGGDLPNDIAASGHGSTEVTNGSGTESFNVQSSSSSRWTITVVAA